MPHKHSHKYRIGLKFMLIALFSWKIAVVSVVIYSIVCNALGSYTHFWSFKSRFYSLSVSFRINPKRMSEKKNKSVLQQRFGLEFASVNDNTNRAILNDFGWFLVKLQYITFTLFQRFNDPTSWNWIQKLKYVKRFASNIGHKAPKG